MNRVKTLSKLVALSLAAVATSGFAVAKDEEKDSVRSWGPWATLVQPAAGGPQVRTQTLAGPVVPGFGAGDTSRFTAIVPDIPDDTTTTPAVSDICVAGSNCGYALIDMQANEKIRVAAINVAPRLNTTPPQRATPTLNPIPDPGPGMQALTSLPNVLNNVARMTTTSLAINSNTTDLSQTIANANVSFNSFDRDVVGWSTRRTMKDEPSINGYSVNVKGTPFAYGQSRTFDSNPTNALFVYGESTGLDELSTLNLGNVEADYVGRTLGSNTEVNITVDFGQGTWEGSFNGGTDGITQQSMIGNVNVVTGEVGFEASGTINGVNIVSTEVSAGDASAISGVVEGSFYGGDGGVLAGVYDVIKTTAVYTEGKSTDIYVTADPNKVSGALPAVGGVK